MLIVGSPPRGRGRQHQVQRAAACAGLTPAWAGTAYKPCSTAGRQGAHPRVGGDGVLQVGEILTGLGSPPHGRGRLVSFTPASAGTGLTPAWAGTADQVPGAGRALWAHPRVGGDGVGGLVGGAMYGGSPPRGRGRQWAAPAAPVQQGLTPAWAGTAARGRFGCPPRRAHPRVGGDGDPWSDTQEEAPGSPPRGRGRPASRPARVQ